jgi:hypothetical protein
MIIPDASIPDNWEFLLSLEGHQQNYTHNEIRSRLNLRNTCKISL